MATTDKTTIKNWFKNKLKPTQEQFWAWMDSYWHKSEQIPTSQVENLDNLLSDTATSVQLEATEAALQVQIDTKVDKVAGKQLSTEDFTTLLKQKLEGIDMATKLDKGNYAGTGEDLYNGIQNILTVLASDDTTLDELQEIVNYIKQNKSDLENLGISNIAGLDDALAALDGYEYWRLSKSEERIKYGFLYNWYAVSDARNIAATGWHVASSAEYSTLVTYLGGSSAAALALMSSDALHWSSPGSNTSGFDGRGNGTRRYNDYLFYGLRGFSYYRTSNGATSLFRLEDGVAATTSGYTAASGCSVRLIKDSTALAHGETGTYTGNDGRVYKTICIGTQEWLSESLAETKYRDGSVIPEVTDTATWSALVTGAICAYDNNQSNAIESIITNIQITSKSDVWLDETLSGTGTEEDPIGVNPETMAAKVDKVAGKQLSTEDFTTTLKTKLEDIDMSTKLNTGGYAGTAQDLYNLTQSNYSGVILPTDGSTAMTRVGNADLSWLLKDVKLVLLADDLTEAETIADYDNPQIVAWADLTGASGQVMAKLPRVYYREVLDGNGVLVRIEISPIKLIGFSCHPKFVRPDGTEREFIYIGAYEASNSGSNVLQSISGVAPLTSQTLETFRTRAFARGAGWYPYDFWTQHLIQLLFYINYANFNSQTSLPGYTERTTWNDAYKRVTGRSDILTTLNGTITADLAGLDADLNDANWRGSEKNIANRFLFVENIFGHIWKFMDGCAFNGLVSQTYNYAYITNNPALFSSSEAGILANYERYGASLPGATNENYMQSLQAGFLPKAHGGSSSTYITDYFWSYLDDASRDYFRVVLAGGYLANGGQAGVAARSSSIALSAANSLLGSRLCAAP